MLWCKTFIHAPVLVLYEQIRKRIKDRVLKTEDMESLKVDPWKSLLDISWLWKDFWNENNLAIA